MDRDILLVLIGIAGTALLGVIGFLGKLLWDSRSKIFRLFKKQYFRFFPINFNIALSLKFKEGLNSGIYFSEIKKNINKIIENQNLGKIIKIKDFSDIQNFRNKDEAESYRDKKDLEHIPK